LVRAVQPLLVALELMETLEVILFSVLLLLLAVEVRPQPLLFAMAALVLAVLMEVQVLEFQAKVTMVELGLLMVQLMPLVVAVVVQVQ
jgi:hypothetical protein